MTSKLWIPALLISVTSLLVFADDEKPDARLEKVMTQLKPVLKQIDAKIEVEYSRQGESLLIKHLPQTFKIHGVSKGGEVSAQARDEVGPSFKGFILNVHLQEKGEVNQAVTPQTIRRPYWMTDLNVTTLSGTDRQIYWGLSYGARTDKELLEKIKTTLNSLAE